MSYRALRMAGRHLGRKREDAVRIMIVGGGQAGTLLIKELNNSEKAPGIPVCIVDDDRNKNGKYISGVPIRGRGRRSLNWQRSTGLMRFILHFPR